MRNWFQSRSDAPHWTQLLGINPRKAGIGLAVLLVLLATGYLLLPRYRIWQARHGAVQAQQFFQKKDYSSAVLSARQVLQSDGKNLAATRIMAETADVKNHPAAVIWRARVAELEPGRLTNYLAWANTALRHSEWQVAEQALAKVDVAGKGSVEFNQAAATLAVGERNYHAAETFLNKVAQLEPTNLVNRLNLASVRLQAPNPKLVSQAITTLESLRSDPKLGILALRALAADSLRGTNFARMLDLTAELLARPDSQFTDRLARLNALFASQSTQLDETLSSFLTAARSNVSQLFTLIIWMDSHNRATRTLQLASTLPGPVRLELPIPIGFAEAFETLHDWTGLQNYVANANWQEMEFLRLALLARAKRELGLGLESRNEWRRAVIRAQNNPVTMGMLVRLASSWQWSAEAEELWWNLAGRHVNEQRALLALFEIYTKAGDTARLHDVSLQLYRFDPRSDVAANNVAALSLLLRLDLPRAHKLALENYQRSPGNAIVVSTYAFSLHVQDRDAEGVKVMSALPEEQLRIPQVAAYYGILLAAHKEAEKARKYLGLAARAHFLPEEQALINQARESLPPS